MGGRNEERRMSTFNNLKKYMARVAYYGPGYLVDTVHFLTGKDRSLPSVKKREAGYRNLKGQAYIDEMTKWFYMRTGEKLVLDRPVTFNQKLQWLKIYDTNPLKTVLADKYLVRDWVKGKIGEAYLIPLLGVWDQAAAIDFDALPDRFALKCNHGSGWNIIVHDKARLDREQTKKQLDTWMKKNFAYEAGFELQYRDIVPKIIAEEYIENRGGEIYDYKCYCFHGKVFYIQFISDRRSGMKLGYFDRDWNLQPFVNNHPQIDFDVPKPDNLDELISLAQTLAEGFPFVRVDFYRLNDGTLKFGEMTFSPASGTQDWRPASANKLLGDLLTLPQPARENR